MPEQSSHEAQHILEWTMNHSRQMSACLEDMVLAESPSRDPGTQRRMMDLLSSRLHALDFMVLEVPGSDTGGFLYARPRERDRSKALQMLIGHCDTVWPTGTLGEMPLENADGMIRGPGAYDMKSGLTQILFALECGRELGLEWPLTPVILVNSDEEIGSFESSTAIRRLAKIAARAFVLEPPLGPDARLKTTRKGVGRFTITVHGKAAHAGLDPGKGINAIVELSNLIQQLFAMNDPASGVSVNVGMVEGGINPNVVAPQSRAVVDVRVPSMEDAARIDAAIRGMKPTRDDVTVEVEGFFGRPPLERTPRNRALWEAAKRSGESIGLDLKEAMAGGGSDGNTTSQFTATLDGLGAPGDGAHALHEHILIEGMAQRTALLTLLLAHPPLPATTDQPTVAGTAIGP